MTNISLFLIDDDEDDQGFFLEAIENIDPSITCEVAENGQDGLNKLLKRNHLPDIIFLDLNMPLMNGFQFLDKLKEHSHLQQIPVVILSTSSDHHTITQTLNKGASMFITKPDRFALWESKLSACLSNPSLIKSSSS